MAESRGEKTKEELTWVQEILQGLKRGTGKGVSFFTAAAILVALSYGAYHFTHEYDWSGLNTQPEPPTPGPESTVSSVSEPAPKPVQVAAVAEPEIKHPRIENETQAPSYEDAYRKGYEDGYAQGYTRAYADAYYGYQDPRAFIGVWDDSWYLGRNPFLYGTEDWYAFEDARAGALWRLAHRS